MNIGWLQLQLENRMLGVDPKIYTKCLIVFECKNWDKKDVGNDILKTQRCNQVRVDKDGLYS